MAYKFNPLIGVGLDEVGTGGGGSTNPGGSNTQVQFNDGGSTFGGDDGLTFNKTTNELTVGASTGDGGSAKVYGDINLDDGGASTTTIQCVTPTANRTISFPNATGTVALVAGSNQAVQYNSAGANAGDSGLLYDATSGSLTVGGKTVTTSAPVINLSQTWNSAGTTFTGLKLNVTNTASASGSSLLDLQVGGSSRLSVTSAGQVLVPNGTLSNPSYGFSANTDCGFYIRSTNQVGTVVDGVLKHETTASGFDLSNTPIRFSSNVATSGPDLVLARDSAGVLKVSGYIKQDPVAISALPAAGTVGAGTRGFVNDASSTTFAAQVAVGTNDGGSTVVPVYCDGSTWRIG